MGRATSDGAGGRAAIPTRRAWATLVLATLAVGCPSSPPPAARSGESAARPILADLTLPSLFTDNMVLQRSVDVPVWGSASPGEQITITLGDRRAVAVADGQGRWTAHLAPLEAGGPFDIGDPADVHPKNKKDVGHRLALAARAVAYGQDLGFSGPIYDSMKVEGSTIRLSFKHLGGGLEARGGKALDGFSIAGADRRFVWADAKIDGETVLVSRKDVKQPVAVRYAWGDSPACNLFNKLGLPASPFRTDSGERGGI